MYLSVDLYIDSCLLMGEAFELTMKITGTTLLYWLVYN